MRRDFIGVTDHAKDRFFERFGYLDGYKAIAEDAWFRGQTVENFSGKLRNILEGKQRNGSTVRIFKDACFIFSNDATLITAYAFDVSCYA